MDEWEMEEYMYFQFLMEAATEERKTLKFTDQIEANRSHKKPREE